MRVLIVGGYGVFGGRLAKLLADERRIGLIIAGRSFEKAKAFCEKQLAGAVVRPAQFDRGADPAPQLKALQPHIVVDASGPFQTYGEDGHALVKAAISLGIHYIDLADSSVFVEGIAAFDDFARANRVFCLSGASTLPAVSSAVVRHLAKGLDHLESIEAGIAPSPHARVGGNVVRALCGYAGRPIAVWRGGKAATAYGLTETRRFTIRPPGIAPLPRIVFSLVDVPDARLAPTLWPGIGEVWVGAGPRPALWHGMLRGLARLRRWRLIPPLTPFAGLFAGVRNLFRWGEHRGGMYVRVRGNAGLEAVDRSWHLIAEGDDGPFIPSMAAEALIRRCLAKKPPKVGARAAAEELELSDYDKLFVRRSIATGVREETEATARQYLYRRVLGEAFDWLPRQLKAAHEGAWHMTGTADVERGKGPLAGLVCNLLKLPETAPVVPLTVEFIPIAGGERWKRTFGDTSFFSDQTEGTGAWAGLVKERFGRVTVGLALVVTKGRLDLVVRRWSLFGIPMPLWLAPGGAAFEHVVDGRFAFDVDMRHPLIGRIVRYRGWLAIAS